MPTHSDPVQLPGWRCVLELAGTVCSEVLIWGAACPQQDIISKAHCKCDKA